MKKIISVLAVSALALGSVFAEISLEYTQKALVSTNEGGTSKKLDLSGYDDKSKVEGELIFNVSNDNAGVVVDIDPWYDKAGKKTLGGTGADENPFDQYYGWVKFFDGQLKLQSGVWTSRSVNRMKQDAGQWENSEYEAYKYGIVTAPGYVYGRYYYRKQATSIGEDVTNLTLDTSSGDQKLSTALTFDNGDFFGTAALVTSDFYGTESTWKSGFAFEGGFNIDDETKIQGVLKILKDQEYALAAFLDKKNFSLFDQTFDFVAGVTVATTQNSSNNNSNTTYEESTGNTLDAALDLRVRYELSDTVAITSMNNISYLGSDYKMGGAYYGSGNLEKGVINLWNMLSLAAQVSDTVKATVTGEWFYADTTVSNNGYLSVTPGVTVTPAEGTDITAGIVIRTYGWSNPSESSIAIPFILHVAL